MWFWKTCESTGVWKKIQCKSHYKVVFVSFVCIFCMCLQFHEIIFFAKLSISKTWWNFENSKCNFKLDLISLCQTGGDSRCRLKMKVQPIYLRADEEPNSTGRGQKMEKNFYIEVRIMYFHKFSVYIDIAFFVMKNSPAVHFIKIWQMFNVWTDFFP